MEKRLRSTLQSSAEEFLKSATSSTTSIKSIKQNLKPLIHSLRPDSLVTSSLPSSLHLFISQSIINFKSPSSLPSPDTPPPKRPRRENPHKGRNTRIKTQNPSNCSVEGDPENGNKDEDPRKCSVKGEKTKNPRKGCVKGEKNAENNDKGAKGEDPRKCSVRSLQILTYIVQLCVTHPKELFSGGDLLAVASLLHDNLILFEREGELLSEIAHLCEEWWKGGFEGKESLISQSLPVLLSKSLISKKKIDVHRVYVLREAFSLFDFEDESIDDLRHLLIRCLISPMYLKTEEGRKFVVFMFGLSGQLVKEVLAMVKSQIPFGRKSMLEAYGEIVFKAWKAMEGEAKDEIENGFLQGLIESAIYAGTLQLSSSIRRVLGWFISQRTVEGVEKLLFRLAEPLIFRSLQVANSNVRQNALHLLLDLFPFEDPDATKDVKDSLFEKQFYLLEKLVMDECSGVRVVAVEGCSRILNMFWEIIPSHIITKIITNFFDQMSYDASTEVRLSTVNGIIYLLGNPLSHEVLKVLLPRFRHLIDDDAVSVRTAVVDLLLCLNDIRNFQFHKVVPLDLLLSRLATDQPLVGRKITKLLIPSYFPEKVSEEEACKRCLMLIKRSPIAGARFCEFSLSEGTSLGSLQKLFELLLSFILSPEKLSAEHLDALLTAASCLCKHLVNNKNFKVALRDNLSGQKLKHLFAIASTAQAQSSLCDIVSAISPDAVDDLFEDCMKLILNCSGLTDSTEKQGEVRAAHKMVISCNWFEDMLEAIVVNLQKTVSACNVRFSINTSGAKKRSKSSKKLPKTIKSFDDDYAIAAGLAWQIKDLLVSGNTRNAVLLSPHLTAVLNAFKAISEISILQCMQCDTMSASPISAYTALALHMSLNNISINGSKTPNVKMNYEIPAVELTMDNIFNCTNKLFRPNASGMCGPTAINGKRVSNLLKILTAIMKFTVDTAMMDLISCRDISLKFLLKCIQFVVSNLKKCSTHLKQLRKEDLAEIFHCLKSSITYSAKFLNVASANSFEESSPPGCYHLANELLNLTVTAEECLGYMYAVRLHAVIKPWMPDIIISLGSLYLLNPASVESIATDDDTISSCPTWLSILAKVELCELRDLAADKVPEEDGFVAFRKLMKMMLEQLRMNYDVLDAVGSAFLGITQLALEKSDLDLLLGLLCFICVKLIKSDDQHQGHLKMMLTMVDNMYQQIEAETEKSSNSSDSRVKLHKAKALLEQIWMNYSYNDSEEHMEEM